MAQLHFQELFFRRLPILPSFPSRRAHSRLLLAVQGLRLPAQSSLRKEFNRMQKLRRFRNGTWRLSESLVPTRLFASRMWVHSELTNCSAWISTASQHKFAPSQRVPRAVLRLSRETFRKGRNTSPCSLVQILFCQAAFFG